MSRTLPQYQSPPIPPERLREVTHQARERATIAFLAGREGTARLWMQIIAACESRLAEPIDGGAEVGMERSPLPGEDPLEVQHAVAPHFTCVHVPLRGLLQ